MRLRGFAFVSAGLVLAICARARADGCYVAKIAEVGRAGPLAESGKQEAILIPDGPYVKVILRTQFRQGPEELAWVVPVPAKPERIEPGDDHVFETLERQTAPRFERFISSGPGLSCGCSANVGESQIVPGVQVEQTGTAGVFEFTVLSSRDSNELTGWLQDHQYRVPAHADAVFRRYVREGWHWLAMRVRPEMKIYKDLAPHPITYTYRADKLIFPLAISQLSAGAENEVVLYVMAKGKRYACVNWETALVWRDSIHLEPGSPSGTNYESLFRSETNRHFGYLFVTEFAGEAVFALGTAGANAPSRPNAAGQVQPNDIYMITRLHALVPRDALDRDVELTPTEGGAAGISNVIMVRNDRPAPVMARLAMPLVPVGLMGMGLHMRRRRRFPRWAAVPVFGLACLAFAML